MPITIVLSFLWAPPAEILGETSRVLFFHVPIAWVSVLAFLVSGIFSIIYLSDRNKKFVMLEEKSHASATIGMVFCLLTTITGSIWAKMSWGSYWNWDPRETSIVILLLIYIAYFSLRSALANNEARGRICSSYLIFAMVMVPIFIFIIPRMYHSLHPNPIIKPENKIKMETTMRIVLLLSVFTHTLLYFYIFKIMNRISFIEKKLEEDEL